MRVRALVVVLLAWLGAVRPAVAGGDATTAADATESGRRIGRALDLVLDASMRVATGPRTLALVVDPSASLVAAGFPDRFEAALDHHAEKLATTEFVVLRVGGKDPVVLGPTSDRAAAARAVRTALTAARNETHNVYADVRAAVQALSGRPGAREVLLVTLENGDAEDDLEGTVRALERGKVRCFVLAREAYLSDSYWHSHPRTTAPRGTTFTGGDAAFAEVPWGFVLQRGNPNEEASSGFGPFGLTRLAAATGGRVFLHDDPASSHRCTANGVCRFCAGTDDHAPAGEGYLAARTKPLAPSVAARDDVYVTAGRDPAYRVVLATWKKLADAGLVRSRPSIEGAGAAWKAARVTTGAAAPLLAAGLAFTTGATRASKALEACERIRAELEADLVKTTDDASPRARAIAEYVRLMLYVTRANLIQLGAWCQDTGPTLVGKKPRELLAPELAWRSDPDLQYSGIAWSDLPLCHGVGPVLDLSLPGGAAMHRALGDLDGVFKAYLARYGGTPFGVAARRASIALFFPGVVGKAVPLPRTPNGGSEPATTTPADRPTRDGGGGTSSGPTTSGG